jgi:hypothetical protein
MNRWKQLIVILCITFIGYNFYSKPDTDNWTEYRFELSNIKVQFPHTPKVEKHFIEGIGLEFTSARNEFAQYTVSYMSGFGITNDKFYPHALVDKGATISYQKDIWVGEYLGKQFELDYKNKVAVQRFIDVKGATVQQTAIFSKKNRDNSFLDGFLDSLAL